MVQNVLMVREKVFAIKNPVVADIATKLLDEYETAVIPKLVKCRRSWIHGDLNDRVCVCVGDSHCSHDTLSCGAPFPTRRTF
jgi:hypothetical protein